MKTHNLIFLLIIFGGRVVAQNTTFESSLSKINVKVDSLLKKLTTMVITEEEKKGLKTLGYLIQNEGLLQGDSFQNYTKSLELVNTALSIWTALNDTLNEANNRKYKGLLHGHLNNFREAKTQIEYAIKLFSGKKALWGVAVSHFDLSKVYEIENKLDSALIYNRYARLYWNSTVDTGRILINNNQAINIYYRLNDLPNALLIQKSTAPLLKKSNLHWQNVLDFNFLSYILYHRLNDKILSASFQRLYKNKLPERKQLGVTVKSIYEKADN
ncbi:hypothetical protein [Daejeonella sp.]|uniref:hypothetical protein n=1 Tax=Daejeonella sp. TaxID=2805397 RepID=UPI0030C56132